ncbi:hypothetical protein QR680_006827 [Steinernema hermaphroditum]|uniref:Uncharacterized protein n=1 Tax=Steinernema hermaphroditum TaxID=289476 RepID=A0AA39HWK9_9BILA|nr:hypothetical protein QR680_006827 [Steinernema hermaphroditum]
MISLHPSYAQVIVACGRGQRQSADLGDANSTELADAVASQLVTRCRRGEYKASYRHLLLKIVALQFNCSMFVFMDMEAMEGNDPIGHRKLVILSRAEEDLQEEGTDEQRDESRNVQAVAAELHAGQLNVITDVSEIY